MVARCRVASLLAYRCEVQVQQSFCSSEADSHSKLSCRRTAPTQLCRHLASLQLRLSSAGYYSITLYYNYYNTQHYILPYARTHVFKTSFFPSTIKIWNNLQPVITNSTTIPQLRQALQSTPTSGRRGAPCSAGSEWTPHAS